MLPVMNISSSNTGWSNSSFSLATSNFADAWLASTVTTNTALSVVGGTNVWWYWVQAQVDGKLGKVSAGDSGYRLIQHAGGEWGYIDNLAGVSDGATGLYYEAMRDTTPYASFLRSGMPRRRVTAPS